MTEREALERLEVAGATLLTDDELLPDCDTLRLELELVLLTLRLELELPELTLRLELELLELTLRLELELLELTLRLELELPLLTLRLEDVPDTLRPDAEPEVPFTDLDATEFDDLLTLRLLLEPDIATRSVVVRLRLRSQPPLLILRFPTKLSTLPSPGT